MYQNYAMRNIGYSARSRANDHQTSFPGPLMDILSIKVNGDTFSYHSQKQA